MSRRFFLQTIFLVCVSRGCAVIRVLRFAQRTPILRIAEAVVTKFPLSVPCADFRDTPIRHELGCFARDLSVV